MRLLLSELKPRERERERERERARERERELRPRVTRPGAGGGMEKMLETHPGQTREAQGLRNVTASLLVVTRPESQGLGHLSVM